MFSKRIGVLLKNARRQLKLSRDELASRGGVSTRLVAELERGQRPNVSLESALRLLNVVGVSIIARSPGDVTTEIRNSPARSDRAARAARRRQSWTGGHIHLHDEGDGPPPGRSKAKRVSAVSGVSRQAYLIASSGRGNDERSTINSHAGLPAGGKSARKRRRGSRREAEDLRRLSARKSRKKREQ
jgi:transcriptional regulator with XRE-family HTH domain